MINKIIWILWLQGWDRAPWLVRKCLASWQHENPGWEVRALDAGTLQRYIELPDLQGKDIGPATLSDIVRICLLREYGGVWVDATVLCHRPLDSWLPVVTGEGFFAFDRPGYGRMLSSWFLAAAEDSPIIARWHAATLDYWRGRRTADAYFWFHYLFGTLYETCPEVRDSWDHVVKVSAHHAHVLQEAGLLLDNAGTIDALLSGLPPVSKLTYRYDTAAETPRCLVRRLLSPLPAPDLPRPAPSGTKARPLASLKVSTRNLGDHIQIIAARRLIERTARGPEIYIDRDDEIGSAPGLDPAHAPYPIVLNGWFKTNAAEWPPAPTLDPVYIGFHIRLFQCPRLVAEDALDHYRHHQPVGCRDTYTSGLLASHGIETYVSHCLTLSFPRRESLPEQQTEVFVVSRDDRILSWLPPHLKDSRFVCHYVEETDFETNLARAEALLDLYRTRARLIVTTLLHCALPAIAMGIPVVMFYPENSEAGHASDMERFSSLAELIPIHDAGQTEGVNWNPAPVRVGRRKLAIIDHFQAAIEPWRLPLTYQSDCVAQMATTPVPQDDPVVAMPVAANSGDMKKDLRPVNGSAGLMSWLRRRIIGAAAPS